jgi:RHS repeat-associated protein
MLFCVCLTYLLVASHARAGIGFTHNYSDPHNYDTACGFDGAQWDNVTVNFTGNGGAPPGDYAFRRGGTGSSTSVDVRVFEDGSWAFVAGFYNFGDANFVDQQHVDSTWNIEFQPANSTASIDGEQMTWGGIVHDDCAGVTTVHGAVTITIGNPLPGQRYTKPNDSKTCPAGADSIGMARSSAHLMQASLNIEDTPFHYVPPRGPAVSFTATYNQRDDQQPVTFNYSNLGQKWTFNWLSYVTDDPNNSAADAALSVAGGGREIYTGFASGSESLPDAQSHAVLVRVSNDPIKYEKRFPDGSKYVFEKSDQASSNPRKIFMTQVVDPLGSKVSINYESGSLRISSLTDDLGNVTQFWYDNPADPFKITRITEPSNFVLNRFVMFTYTNGQLTKITDVIGIESQFHYLPGTNFIDSLTTPYGTSHFATGQTTTTRWIEMTDPEMSTERVEYQQSTSGIGSNEPVPNGFSASGLDQANTFFWDKKAYSYYPDYTKARITHWLQNPDNSISGIAGSAKAPLENRVWYKYDGQPDQLHVGPSANPIQVMRLLDNGSPKLWQYEYNTFGKVTKVTDPVTDPYPRVTSYVYDTNNIDLLTVRQMSGSNNELLRTLTYNSLHEPLTDKDAAGQTTNYNYRSDGHGQVQSIQNAKGETTTYSYGPVDGVPADYLASITSPPFNGNSAVTSFTYDDARRVHTVKNEADDYTVTKDYDNLDRPTQISYPDGTNRQFQYSQDFGQGLKTILDLTKSIDRRGRPTTRHYNANRQMDSITDPLSRTTTYNWCTCGALTSILDPGGNLTTFNRDLQSRVYQKVFADQTSINYVYENTTSRLKSMTDALSQTTNYQYFADDNLQQINYTNAVHTTPTVSFIYDPNYNRVGSMTDGTGTTNYSYYLITATPPLGAGQLHTVDGPLANDLITYGYDELGRVISRSINNVASSVTYDSLGRLNTSDNVLGHFTRAYDGTTHVTPRIQTVNYPNGQMANYTYLDRLHDFRLQTLQDLTSSSINVSKFDYANYDPEGQIKDWTKTLDRSTPIASSHIYDLADQLTEVTNTTTGNPPTSLSYGYDSPGNRTSDNSASYSINDVNEITNKGYAYDLNGNMTSDGVLGFEWDAANRLTAIVHPGDGGRSEFAYDGLSRRVQIVEKDGSGAVQRTSKFVWDGQTIAEERNGLSTVVKRFLPEGVQILANASPNQKLFYSRDHLGSVRSLTNENGALLSSIDYDPYGSISRPPVPANVTTDGPVITGAVSRKTQGGAGTFDVTLPLSGAPGIEMRNLSGNYTLVLTFDRTVVSGTATIASGVGTAGLPTFSGNTATVSLSGVADRQTITVELDNVLGVTGLTAKVFVAMSVLVGDVNQNGAVTADDIDLVKGHLGATVDNSTFKYDVNANGAINSSDLALNKTMYGDSLFPDFAFTGHYYHARSGLYLTTYRDYSPALGRWLSRDPIGERGGLNLYGYVGNDPIRSTDPLGLKIFPTNYSGAIGPGDQRGFTNEQYLAILQILNVELQQQKNGSLFPSVDAALQASTEVPFAQLEAPFNNDYCHPDNNIMHPTLGEIDLEWFTDITLGTPLGYVPGKLGWDFARSKTGNPLPFSDPGEWNAFWLVVKGYSYSEIFTPPVLKAFKPRP